MTAKTKLLTTAGALLALFVLFVVLLTVGDRDRDLGSRDGEPAHDLRAQRMPRTAPSGALAREPERQDAGQKPADAQPAQATGSLRVRVVRASDKAARAGVRVRACLDGYLSFFGRREAATDPNGEIVFEDLRPGHVLVVVLRFMNKLERPEIAAGKESLVTFELPDGIDINGLVVDAADRPVADAEVMLSPWAQDLAWPVLRTDANGRFALTGISDACHVGARADGHAPSPMHQLRGMTGTIDLRVRLAGPGGAVRGTVVDGFGNPVASAIVDIGDRRLSMLPRPYRLRDGTFARKQHVRSGFSDATGQFHFRGLPLGESKVAVRARRFAPWRGKCTIVAGQTAEVRVRLAAPVTVEGTIHDVAGTPLAGVTVSVGKYGTLEYAENTTRKSGAYVLRGLPEGRFMIVARTEDRAKTTAELTATAGQTLRWDARLGITVEIRGRVVDADGKPLPSVRIDATPRERGSGWFGSDYTDESGRFVLRGCTPDAPVDILVSRKGYERVRREAVVPKPGELLIRLESAEQRTVWVEGAVVDPAGMPVVNAVVKVTSPGNESVYAESATGKDGRFRVGPLAPGDLRAVVESRGYPRIVCERRGVTAGQTWTIGRVELIRPGFLVVRVRNETKREPRLALLSAEGAHIEWLKLDGDHARLTPLAPGDYWIAVRGSGIAHLWNRVTVRPGAELSAEIPIRAGTPIRMRLSLPASATRVRRAHVTVQDAAGRRVLGTHVYFRRGRVATRTYAFAPGRYELRATADGGLAAESPFEIGESESAVEVTLR